MKTLNQASNTKKIILLALVVVVLGTLTYGVFAKQDNKWPFAKPSHITSDDRHDTNYKPPTDDQKLEGERIKERSVDQSDETTTPSTGKMKVSATITSANQNSGKLQIRFLIQALDKGTCVLRLTKGTTTVTKTSNTQTLPNSTTCQGFDIPLSELSAGEWTYTMDFTSTKNTASVTDKVAIQ